MKKHRRVGYGKGTTKKCVRTQKGEVVYVSNSEAARLVAQGGSYVPKSVWKQEVRDKAVEVKKEVKVKSKRGNPKGKKDKINPEA